MRWTPGSSDSNIEDRRGTGGGGGRVRLGLGGILLLGLLSFVFKTDLVSPFLSLGGGASGPASSAQPDPRRLESEKELAELAKFVLNDTQETWRNIFKVSGATYRDAKLVLFWDGVQSACGPARAESGPFYCPADEKAYIDLSFYDELNTRFGAPGDFAQAYVLAHEIGHHVQKLLGVEEKVRGAQRANPDSANALSVRMELQADCFAGVWGHAAAQKGVLETGDVEEGLSAAAAIGDDRIQKMSGGYVQPESFTHGSSAQRVEWFKRGLSAGRLDACNTFNQ